MNKFRKVYSVFWTDPLVSEDMSPEDRYFFLYLLTNSSTTQIGIYPLSRRTMAFDLGYSLEAVDALLERFIHQFDIVSYNKETCEIAIKNWGRYNLSIAGKPIIDCVKAELRRVRDRSLIAYVGERIHNKTIKALFIKESSKVVD